MVSAWHKYVGGTGIVSCAADGLGMKSWWSVYVFDSGGVGGEGEWIRVLGLGFTNHVRTGGVMHVCLCLGCSGVGGEWVGGLNQCVEVWCYVCVSCESGLSV